MFQELTPSPSSGCAGGLVAKKPRAHPEDGDGVSHRNVRKFSHHDMAVCPRKFN